MSCVDSGCEVEMFGVFIYCGQGWGQGFVIYFPLFLLLLL